jgi:hypothetical protein
MTMPSQSGPPLCDIGCQSPGIDRLPRAQSRAKIEQCNLAVTHHHGASRGGMFPVGVMRIHRVFIRSSRSNEWNELRRRFGSIPLPGIGARFRFDQSIEQRLAHGVRRDGLLGTFSIPMPTKS